MWLIPSQAVGGFNSGPPLNEGFGGMLEFYQIGISIERIYWIKALASAFGFATPETANAPGDPKQASLSPEDMAIVQSAATCALRFAYHTAVNAPLPATFMSLLEQLAARGGEDADSENEVPRWTQDLIFRPVVMAATDGEPRAEESSSPHSWFAS
jgi:hypothetical protein